MATRGCLLLAAITIFAFTLSRDLPAATVPPEVIKSVAFVYVPNPKTGVPAAAGTCFFVGIPNPKKPGRVWLYAVTARHVLRASESPDSPIFPHVWIRINGLNGHPATMFDLALSDHGANENVFYHADPTVDIAVIGLPTSVFGGKWNYDQVILNESLLTTSAEVKSLKIGPGTDLFFAGMFDQHLGDTENTPIVRFGRVSMLPGERIRFGASSEEVFLAEMFSFGGNSGSPVFYYMGLDRSPGAIIVGNPVIKVAGVMQGFFTGNEPLDSLVFSGRATAENPNSTSDKGGKTLLFFPPNSGIAAIVPAQKILDILNGDVLTRLREVNSGQTK